MFVCPLPFCRKFVYLQSVDTRTNWEQHRNIETYFAYIESYTYLQLFIYLCSLQTVAITVSKPVRIIDFV